MAKLRYGQATSSRDSGTVERVLEAAETLVRAGEFHSATMDDLAASAGVSRATVFSRFGTRLGVLEALNERCSGSPEILAIRATFEVDDPLIRLERLVDASCRFWEEWGGVQLHLRAIVTLEPEVRPLIEGQRQQQAEGCQELAARLAEAELLRPDIDPSTAGTTLHMLTSLEAFTELRHNGGLDLEATIDVVHSLTQSLLRSQDV